MMFILSACIFILQWYQNIIYQNTIQVEQEMAMIIGKKDIKSLFEKAWTTTYVPALLQYGERSKKKILRDILSDLIETGKNYCMYIYLLPAF